MKEDMSHTFSQQEGQALTRRPLQKNAVVIVMRLPFFFFFSPSCLSAPIPRRLLLHRFSDPSGHLLLHLYQL